MNEIITYSDAQQTLASLDAERLEGMLANAAYLSGDHWQRGEAWGGPPIPADMSGAGETLLALQRDLAPVPVLAEVAEAYVTGVAGNEPAFSVDLRRELAEGETATPEEAADVGRLNDALTAFFDTSGAMEAIHEFVANLLSGRGALRFYMPPMIAEKANRERPFTNLNEACANFYLEAPEWHRAGVHTDRRSMRRTGIYLYAQQQETPGQMGEPDMRHRAEITTVLDDERTLFRIVDDGSGGSAEQSFDCNGQVWVYQATLPRPLLGEPQRALQRKIDFLNFILPKNAQYAGFRERNFIGVQKQKDAGGEEVDAELGPATVNYWQPSFYEDTEGNKKPAAATLVISEPVDSSSIRADKDDMIRCLLKSVHQLHTVISGDATASAVSRVQSRASFTRALLKLKPKVEKVLRELFETVLCLACGLAGEEALLQRYKAGYRIRVDLKPDAGPLTPEERKVIVEQYQAGLMSAELAMVMLGIEDVGAEFNRIASEGAGNVDMQIKRAQLFNEYSQSFEPPVAAALAGWSEEMLRLIPATSVADEKSGEGK